jgi:hypothetical protein
MEKSPYVHLYTDVLEAMPLLARGSNAAVFVTIGILLPKHPNGPQLEDLVRATGLSVRTVQAALTHLIGSGLVAETTGGDFTPNLYIDYRRNTHNVCNDPIDRSINLQSKTKNHSNQSALIPEKNDFGLAYNALETLLILGGGGLSPVDREAFKELWTEYPDPELHRRARDITKKRATRPNYKYYERVVQTGAIEYDAKENKAELIEVLL